MKYELDNVYLFCVAHGCDYEQNLPCKDGYYPVHDSLGICEEHYNTTGHDYLMIRASNLVFRAWQYECTFRGFAVLE